MTATAGAAPFRTDGAPTYCTVLQAVTWLTEHGQPCSREWLYERIRAGQVRRQTLGARRTMRVLLADVQRLLPAPPAAEQERELSAFERVNALLPRLNDDERRRVMLACLTAPTATQSGLPAAEGAGA